VVKSGSARVWLLLAVLALGLGLRVANLVAISSSPFFTRPVIDGQAYDTWAMTIVQGKAAAQPFYQDPLYPYFLALIYSVFGHNYWAVYLVQLLLAAVFLLLVYDTARRLFDWRAGIAAAAIAGLYKPLIFYESQIEKTALAVFLIALFLWLFVRASSLKAKGTTHSPEAGIQNPKSQIKNPTAGRWLWPLASGIGLGLAALTRANTLLFAPLLPLALAFMPRATGPKPTAGNGLLPPRHQDTKSPDSGRLRVLLPAGASLLGVLLIIAPVSIRNSVLAHEFTLTTTQAGQNLYIGNSPYNPTGQCQEPPWVRPNPDFEQADFAEYANKAAGRTLSYSGVSRFYTHAALSWATSHGSDFARLLWRKTILYFNNFEVPDNQDMYFFARYSWVLRLPLLSFGLVFGLGLAAMILLTRPSPATDKHGLTQTRSGPSVFVGANPWSTTRLRLSLVVFYFGYAASVIAFFVFSRYRIPALPALLPFSGAMLVSLFNLVRPTRPPSPVPRPSSPAPRPSLSFSLSSLALVLAAFALTTYPVHHGSGKLEAAQSLTNLASVYFHEGDTTRAIATYNEALRTQPGHAEASRNLGIIMLGRGETDRAFQLLSDAVRADPSNPTSHVYLGRAYERRGELEPAFIEFGKAVALSPGRVEFRFELATALQQENRYPEALAQYDTMVQLAPDNPAVRHNFAVCLYNVGRLDDARTQLEAARRLGGPINPRFDSLLNAGRHAGR